MSPARKIASTLSETARSSPARHGTSRGGCAASDRRLPGLRLVLDPAAMGDALESLGAPRLETPLRATYVRYQPGTSCLVGFESEVVFESVEIAS